MKDNIKVQKQNKTKTPKYTAQWLTTKWTVIWPRNKISEPLIQYNYFFLFWHRLLPSEYGPKNYVLVCLLLKLYK